MSDEREDQPSGSDDHDAAPVDGTVPTGSDTGDAGAGKAAAGDPADAEPATGEPADLTKPSSGAAARPAGKPRARREAAGSRPARTRPTADTSPGATGKGRATRDRATAEAPARRSPLARLRRFLREVVAELRKVIWPSRNQLVTYTTVVLVFVSFMVALVAGLDIVFARGVLWLFG